ncbi:MAG: cytidylate kinase [Candidatus Marinimicrobia bacterium]|nr:cytidylate kinase [Candidatus Neomarinimicrobiota bacterium]
MIIAIDGPAGSGKSTTAKIIADKLKISYLDTGAMYRAVTAYFIDNNYSVDSDNMYSIMDSIIIEFHESSVLLNNQDFTYRLRDNDVSSLVSKISSNKIVRDRMVLIQRNISENKSIVVDGRDIGTVVFPNADYKFFITAGIKERASRRYRELKLQDREVELINIEQQIEERDYLDSTRKNSPLKKADGAIVIDTTHLHIEEQVNTILKIINNN